MSTKTLALNEKLERLDLLPPVTVEEDASYETTLAAMRRAKQGSVLVCRAGKLTGIFTERDVLNRCLLEKIALSTPIRKLMTPNPATARQDSTLGEAVELMHAKGARNLPIVDSQGRPKGLLTVGRVIRYLADHYPAEVVNLPPVLHQTSHETEGA